MSRPAEPGACPICGKPRDPKLRPFCSKRCADLDLARWLKGEYAIPGARTGPDGAGPDCDEPPEIH